MEGNSLMSTHKQIFIKMVASKKKGPGLSEYFYSLFGTCVKSKKWGNWNLKMGSLEALEKSLNFTAEKVYKPWIELYVHWNFQWNSF